MVLLLLAKQNSKVYGGHVLILSLPPSAGGSNGMQTPKMKEEVRGYFFVEWMRPEQWYPPRLVLATSLTGGPVLPCKHRIVEDKGKSEQQSRHNILARDFDQWAACFHLRTKLWLKFNNTKIHSHNDWMDDWYVIFPSFYSEGGHWPPFRFHCEWSHILVLMTKYSPAALSKSWLQVRHQ